MAMKTQIPTLPLRPDYSGRTRSSGQTLMRAACATLTSAASKGVEVRDPLTVVRRKYDANTALLTKAVTTPATMTNADWAGVAVATSVADFGGVLGPASAFATLADYCLQFRFVMLQNPLVEHILPELSRKAGLWQF